MEKAYTDALGEESAEPAAYAYDALGERVAMYDSTGDTEYAYDSLGRITSVTTYRTPGEDGGYSREDAQGDTVIYTYDGADNLAAITYPDGTKVCYEYDLNDNLIKVTDREGLATTYVYDAINRITEIHRPNGISTYNTYNGEDQITELTNICDDCGWVISRYAYTYDERGFITAETAVESLAGYAYDDKHDGKHEDGRHDDLYPHGNKHAKHDKDAAFAYQIVETDRTFVYDDAGKLLSATETEDNYGTYVYTYEYDFMGNRTAVIKTDEDGEIAESRKYVYNESNQLVSVELFNGKKTTSVSYTYDADGRLISETGKDGTDKVELTYTYTVENRLEAVYDGKELLMAAAYDGDGNRVFQLNYNLHTDEDWKGNSGNGNGSNKDNAGSGSSSSGDDSSTEDDGSTDSGSGDDSGSDTDSGDDDSSSSGNNGNGNGNSDADNSSSETEDDTDGEDIDVTEDTTGTGDTTADDDSTRASEADGDTSTDSTSTGNGNATNAETNNSQNQSGILFPIDSETSDTESYLISLIKTSGKEKNYELIEYINDVNREYTEVLAEQNINGALDTAYVYGAAIGTGSDRLSLDRFDGSTGYYLYDPRGSVTGITNEEGQVYQSYRYSVFGEITFGAPQYENEYTYNGESYNPNIESQYLRARYYCVVTAVFLTEDSYLGNITEPLTLNRYLYCVASPVNYADPSGHKAIWDLILDLIHSIFGEDEEPKVSFLNPIPISPTPMPEESQTLETYIDEKQQIIDEREQIEDCDLLLIMVDTYNTEYIVEYLKKFEDFSESAYYATGNEKELGLKTIGYGHLCDSDADKIYCQEGYTISEEDATQLLISDIQENFPGKVFDEISKSHRYLSQNQVDSLVALRFNNTAFSVKGSPNFIELLKQESYDDANFNKQILQEFLTYTKQNGEILPGLVKRSIAEAMLFIEGNYLETISDPYGEEAVKLYEEFLIKYEQDEWIYYLE